jgi:adenosylcobyric acid synthase
MLDNLPQDLAHGERVCDSRAMTKRCTPAIMFQGTGSDVGKSLLVAGLCRWFRRKGLDVRPFKPQNMSNNAAVTADGGEIGRAQALQARACGLLPHSDMNPVLLKPASETGAQVVVQGRVMANASARDYYALKPTLLPMVLDSFQRLSKGADLVIVEGAGSAAEVNLRAADIANMGFAEAADLPVVLVGDIDRGGVIASIVGTHALLPPSERARLKGYVINKFRGDASLFTPALDIIRDKSGLDSLGIVPWFAEAARLPAEDAASLGGGSRGGTPGGIHMAVLRLSRIANFDDFDPLAAEDGVRLTMVAPGQPLPADADLVILPGSKATIADLAFLRTQGWDIDLAAHVRRGGRVLGICAGYQMLGRLVSDPLGVEGPPGSCAAGLGLLDIETVMAGDKVLTEIAGHDGAGAAVRGYEMHMGRTTGPDTVRPMLVLEGKPEGAVSRDGRVQGCYLHGLFGSDPFRHRFLSALRPGREGGIAYDVLVDDILDRLADHLGHHIAVDRLLEIARQG